LSRPAPPGYAERVYHSWVAGSLGGYFIWGRYSSINHQILLHLSSRVMCTCFVDDCLLNMSCNVAYRPFVSVTLVTYHFFSPMYFDLFDMGGIYLNGTVPSRLANASRPARRIPMCHYYR
jgi:hypothetical protein